MDSVSLLRSKGLRLKADKLEVMPYENIREGILHQIPCQLSNGKSKFRQLQKLSGGYHPCGLLQNAYPKDGNLVS